MEHVASAPIRSALMLEYIVIYMNAIMLQMCLYINYICYRMQLDSVYGFDRFVGRDFVLVFGFRFLGVVFMHLILRLLHILLGVVCYHSCYTIPRVSWSMISYIVCTFRMITRFTHHCVYLSVCSNDKSRVRRREFCTKLPSKPSPLYRIICVCVCACMIVCDYV